jgi:RimJ/RimL family protein N-acetyltransferase
VYFGFGVLKVFWASVIAKHFLKQTTLWADENGIQKISLHVLETNEKAIKLYERFGFEVEGVLKKDKFLSDGNYYNTIVMGRIRE